MGMINPTIGVSMLYCLGKPFSYMTQKLQKLDYAKTSLIEIVDEALHTLNRKRVKILQEIARSQSIAYTVHAPFADINIAAPSEKIRNFIIKRLKKSISHASELDAKLWVFHPGVKTGVTYFYPGLEWKLNLESTQRLLRIAEEYGLKIAIENVPEPYPFLLKSVEDFSKFFAELNEDLNFTLDIGHANLNSQIEVFIKRFSNRLVHVHVSDNNGESDSHLGVGYGNINWKHVAKAIKEVSFNGTIVVESVEHVLESVQKLHGLFLK
jgi:sugar phosphate isomerase/epimerase